MRAAVLHGSRDLRFDAAAPDPVPAPGEVLVRVARAGLCGSDLHVWRTGEFIATFNSAKSSSSGLSVRSSVTPCR